MMISVLLVSQIPNKAVYINCKFKIRFMQIEVFGFDPEENELLKEALDIRFEVFVQEQNVDKRIEYDGLDSEATHYLVKVNEKFAGTARWRETENGIKLERFAVRKAFRGRGLATVLLKFILHELIPSGKLIYLHAQDAVENFYEFYGFKRVGDAFYEAEIKHYLMHYKKQSKQH
jgi:predicted GNAT family N-acyltransferase